MTMRILLTAAAIISSTGFGVSQSPSSHDSIHSPVASLAQASAGTQRDDPRDALDALDALDAIDAIDALDAFHSFDRQGSPFPPKPWAIKDPADSLYRLAREAMSRNDYKRAAELFHRISERFPQSAYASQSIYYEAFALYRIGGDDDLSTARDRLKQLKQRDAKIWKSDGAVLLTRICGELAKRGDQDCAVDIEKLAQDDRPAQGNKSCPSEDDENDDRIAALNALLQMDADRAMPILKKVLERRDACSAGLRRQALFLVSQKRTDETANILMNAARNDPDAEVREKAVFWLSQVPGSTPLLEGILKGNADQNIKEQARQGDLLAWPAPLVGKHGVPPQSLLADHQSGPERKDSVLAVAAEGSRKRAVAHEHRRQSKGRHRAAEKGALLGGPVGSCDIGNVEALRPDG